MATIKNKSVTSIEGKLLSTRKIMIDGKKRFISNVKVESKIYEIWGDERPTGGIITRNTKGYLNVS